MMWSSEAVTDLYSHFDQNMTSAAKERRHHISLRIVYEITNSDAMQCISIVDNSLLSSYNINKSSSAWLKIERGRGTINCQQLLIVNRDLLTQVFINN
jgi:hypothetical protein